MSKLDCEQLGLGNGSVAWSPNYIGENVIVGFDCNIGALSHIGNEVILGNRVRVQGGAYIANKCVIKDDVFIGPNSTLLNDKYPPSGDSEKWMPVVVEARAVIGGGSTVLPGVVVGENSVLAAGAVLTKNIPPGEVWAGNPAKYLMSRMEYEVARDE
ncbi:MAG: acyltransferase [Candidatus Thalassarchaeaceae archaeon]|jgi:acetyltransferase-like isoleucine patch superfamily enzyme|nr:acyltransferase [Candidatus Thalassarchaeaceae archaeon]